MEKYTVMYKNEPIGEAEVSQDGLFTVLRCECVSVGGVVRLYGFHGDDFYPIGILTPVGSRLRLVKKYTKNDLHDLPIQHCDRFELYGADEEPKSAVKPKSEPVVEPAPQIEPEEPQSEPEPVVETVQESLWKPIDDPSTLFADEELKATAADITGGMMANDDGSTLLAIPISTDTPFPLMPVFRYGWSAMVEGKCCIVFRIKDGCLI